MLTVGKDLAVEDNAWQRNTSEAGRQRDLDGSASWKAAQAEGA